MIKVLFVCTGNVFRSMIAEKCLNHFAKQNNLQIIADSAGTKGSEKGPIDCVIERLRFHGISFIHKQKKLNRKLLEENDIVIVMNINHKEFIKEKFSVDVPLFNEVAFNKPEGVLDFDECYPEITDANDKKHRLKVKEHAYRIVDYIYNSMPELVKNIERWV